MQPGEREWFLEGVAAQHLAVIADEMGRQHVHADTGWHRRVLFSAYPKFLAFFERCLIESDVRIPDKWFYNAAHKALVATKYLQPISIQPPAGRWPQLRRIRSAAGTPDLPDDRDPTRRVRR